MNEPMTWKQAREDVARLHEGLEGALSRANEAVWNPPSDTRADRIYVDAYADLRYEVEVLTRRSEVLLEMLAESPEPETPARPLEAVLADIRALGHEYVLYGPGRYDGSPEHAVATHLKDFDYRGKSVTEHQQWRREAEDGAAKDPDLTVAAQARLEQIKELREQQRAAVVALVEMLSYRGDRPTEEDIEAFLTAIGAGPEEVDTEHEASVAEPWTGHGRWNVWAKDQRERVPGWWIANANLNEEQARAAVERRKGTDDCEFMALPLDQVPGGPPVDASDALVFLNPDPEVQPGGPTDAEEAALARADHERVRMASEGEEDR